MVEVLIAIAWLIDAGALIHFVRLMARNGTHWHGAPTIIMLMIFVAATLLASGAMMFASDTRTMRLTALAIAGILPLIGGLAFGAVGVIVGLASLFGGRMN